jgi:hypothetical protein
VTVRVNTRAWCRSYAAPAPPGTVAINPPLPDAGAALAEAYLPAPITWGVTVLSSLPASNLVVAVQVAGIDGGWQTIPGLVTIPFLSGPPLPGRACRVLRVGGSVSPGELVTCMVAPIAWPWWAEPEEAELDRGVRGLYRDRG